MNWRFLCISVLFAVRQVICRVVLKWESIPCEKSTATVYDSVLLTEGESLHLSCSVCKTCEPSLRECKKSFDVGSYLRSRSVRFPFKRKNKTKDDVAVTDLRSRYVVETHMSMLNDI